VYCIIIYVYHYHIQISAVLTSSADGPLCKIHVVRKGGTLSETTSTPMRTATRRCSQPSPSPCLLNRLLHLRD
jgi:hypothetical protein